MLLRWLLLWIGLLPASSLAAMPTLRMVVVDVDPPPFVMLQAGGRPKGLIMELADAIARELDTRAEPVLLPRRRLESYLQRGSADLACNMLPQWTARPDMLQWTRPTHAVRDIVVSRHRAAPLTTLQSLAGLKLAVVESYHYPPLEPLWSSGQVLRHDERDGSLVLLALEESKADAAVVADFSYWYWLQGHPLAAEFQVQPLVVNSAMVRCAVSRRSRWSLLTIDAALGRLQDKGVLSRLFALPKAENK